MSPNINGITRYKIFGTDHSNTPPYYSEIYDSLDDALTSIKKRYDFNKPLGSIEVTRVDDDGCETAEVRMQFGTQPKATPNYVRNYGEHEFVSEVQAKWNIILGI